MSLESRICCFYQVFKQEKHIKKDGVGDCQICKTDENNVFCADYFPVTFYLTNNAYERNGFEMLRCKDECGTTYKKDDERKS